jgi:hypothetical protein
MFGKTTGGKAVYIDGIKELGKTIKAMEKGIAQKALVTGMRGGLTAMAKSIRKEVNATPIKSEHESSLKAGMRKAVGSRFVKGGVSRIGKRTELVAKAGFAVGKKKDVRLSRGETHGVGVTRKTVHWFVLPGKGGRNELPKFDNVIDRAVSNGGEVAMQAVAKKSMARFEKLSVKEAAKRRVRP